MTKVEAKREACKLVNALIDSYFGAGQPWTDLIDEGDAVSDQRIADTNRLDAALCVIQAELFRRAGNRGYLTTYELTTRASLFGVVELPSSDS